MSAVVINDTMRVHSLSLWQAAADGSWYERWLYRLAG
jgi:hypothetical protein